MMTFTRPKTGRDSVPFPPSPLTAESLTEWSLSREKADAAETAAEARERVDHEMQEIGLLPLHGRIFDKLVAEFDEVAGRDEYRGLSLDECGLVGEWDVAELRLKWRSLSKAMTRLDREGYLKAAADVAARLTEIVAQFGDGNPWKQEA